MASVAPSAHGILTVDEEPTLAACNSRRGFALGVAMIIATSCSSEPSMPPTVVGHRDAVPDPSKCSPHSTDKLVRWRSQMGCHTPKSGPGRQIEISIVHPGNPNLADSSGEERISIFVDDHSLGDVPFQAYYSKGMEGLMEAAGCLGWSRSGTVKLVTEAHQLRASYDIEFDVESLTPSECPATHQSRGSVLVGSLR